MRENTGFNKSGKDLEISAKRTRPTETGRGKSRVRVIWQHTIYQAPLNRRTISLLVPLIYCRCFTANLFAAEDKRVQEIELLARTTKTESISTHLTVRQGLSQQNLKPAYTGGNVKLIDNVHKMCIVLHFYLTSWKYHSIPSIVGQPKDRRRSYRSKKMWNITYRKFKE